MFYRTARRWVRVSSGANEPTLAELPANRRCRPKADPQNSLRQGSPFGKSARRTAAKTAGGCQLASPAAKRRPER
jgi:hypothetical protein